ncbi:MAG: hypothetical protein FWD62_01725 [Betaproteobacteria bacterium]|nr:hypothetical protein [Betaproteobacteria bacterium]
MSDKLRLEVVLAAIDKASAVFRSTSAEVKKLSQALTNNRVKLKELNTVQKQVGAFRELRTGLSDTAAKLAAAQNNVNQLAKQINAAAPPTRAMTKEFTAAKREAAALSEQHKQQSVRVQELRNRLADAGISTNSLGTHERRLRTDIDSATRSIAAQRAAMDKLNATQKRAAEAADKLQKRQALGARMTIGGYGALHVGERMLHVGERMLHGAGSVLDDAKEYQRQVQQLRLMGQGDREIAEAEKFARANEIIGSSLTDRVKMYKEALAVTRDQHHAEEIVPTLMKMKVAVENVMNKQGHGEGHGEKMESMFMDLVKTAELRGALKDMDTFKRTVDMAMRTYVSSGGQVTPEDLLNQIKTGGVGAKLMADESFFYGLMHTTQEMGGLRAGTGLMSAFQNWAASRNTLQASDEMVKLGLIKPEAIKKNKVGSLTKLAPDSLIGGDKYVKNPFAYLMEEVVPRIRDSFIKSGVKEADITKEMMVMKINQLFSSRKGGDFFASMYLENQNISKHIEAAKHAQGVEGSYKETLQGASGNEAELQAKLQDLRRELGTSVLPLYVAGLEKLASAARSAAQWMERHPRLAKALMIALAGAGLLAVVLGTLALTLGTIIGPFALVNYGLTMLGVKGITAGGGIRIAGQALLWLGRALLMNPIGLAITGIALAAYLIYRYWEPIKGFFAGLWNEIKTAFDGGWKGILLLILRWSPLGIFTRAFKATLDWFEIDLPTKFSGFGESIVKGLIKGLIFNIPMIGTVIKTLASALPDSFKEKLGIKSPSRVFAELGGFTMAGLDQGLSEGQRGPLKTVTAIARRVAAAGALAFGAPAFADPVTLAAKLDTRGPLTARAPAASGMQIGSIAINVTAAPGMDTVALAQEVRRQIEQLPRASAYNASLRDRD